MATQKPISTISYNTESFLKEKLDSYIEAHIIQCYTYIKHKGEDGDKDHIHLRIEPNKRLDPMDIQDDLKEYVKDNKKPLGVRPFRPSKEEDWILYAVHDKDYLELKYGTDKDGKLEYTWQDIVASDGYDVEVAFVRAKQAQKHTAPSVLRQLETGTKAGQLIRAGESPFVVGSVLRYLQTSEYEDMAAKFSDLSRSFSDLMDEYNQLQEAVFNAGFVFDKEAGQLKKRQVTF